MNKTIMKPSMAKQARAAHKEDHKGLLEGRSIHAAPVAGAAAAKPAATPAKPAVPAPKAPPRAPAPTLAQIEQAPPVTDWPSFSRALAAAQTTARATPPGAPAVTAGTLTHEDTGDVFEVSATPGTGDLRGVAVTAVPPKLVDLGALARLERVLPGGGTRAATFPLTGASMPDEDPADPMDAAGDGSLDDADDDALAAAIDEITTETELAEDATAGFAAPGAAVRADRDDISPPDDDAYVLATPLATGSAPVTEAAAEPAGYVPTAFAAPLPEGYEDPPLPDVDMDATDADVPAEDPPMSTDELMAAVYSAVNEGAAGRRHAVSVTYDPEAVALYRVSCGDHFAGAGATQGDALLALCTAVSNAAVTAAMRTAETAQRLATVAKRHG